ncbi:MAG: hypothetical protein ACKOC7_08090, partial [Sphingomonadales bacterium]
GNRASIQFGLVGGVDHPQIEYSKVNYSKSAYATSPRQMIAYADCHDNHTLWDRLSLSATTYSEEQRKRMHRLALAMVLTSQGTPFLHAGTEFLRSKKENENSYNAPDSINAIDWNLKTLHQDNVRMVQQLIDMRKKHPAFQLDDPARRLRFLEALPQGIIAFVVDTKGLGDTWKKVLVLYNATTQDIPINVKMTLTKGKWRYFLRDSDPVAKQMVQSSASIPLRALSC